MNSQQRTIFPRKGEVAPPSFDLPEPAEDEVRVATQYSENQ